MNYFDLSDSFSRLNRTQQQECNKQPIKYKILDNKTLK